jgi:hypothetical protein
MERAVLEGEMRMLQPNLVLLATSVNAIIAVVATLICSSNIRDGYAAVQFTARFSLAIFLLAFAQPGLMRWSVRWPSYVALVRAFLAAHCVHFAAVAVMLVMNPYSMLRANPLQAIPAIAAGFGIVMIAGVTASAREKGYRILHSVTISLVFGIFLLDYASDPRVAHRYVALLLLASAATRLLGKPFGIRETSVAA